MIFAPVKAKQLRKALFLVAAASALSFLSPCAIADVIRLNNGSLIEGQIIRDDDTAIVIISRGSPQFYPVDDVSAVVYSEIRVDPSSKRARSTALSPGGALMDSSIVAKIRERLLTYHGFVTRIGTVVEYLRWGDFQRAGVATQRAAKWVLPVQRGVFSPISALADVLILLGLRATTLWLALAFIREGRAFTRIGEFLVPAYGLLMTLMLYVTVTPSLPIQLALFPLALFGLGWLFAWMFSLTRGRALLAFSITLALNAGIEALLVSSQWLSVGFQNPLLQVAQR